MFYTEICRSDLIKLRKTLNTLKQLRLIAVDDVTTDTVSGKILFSIFQNYFSTLNAFLASVKIGQLQ